MKFSIRKISAIFGAFLGIRYRIARRKTETRFEIPKPEPITFDLSASAGMKQALAVPIISKHSNELSTIYHADCHAAFGDVPDGSVDLIFADPPYNIGKQFGDFKDTWASDEEYAAWCYGWLELCIAKLKPTGSLYVMTSTQAMPYLDLWMRSRMTVLARIVWHYDSSGVQAKKYFGSMYEPMLFCVKDRKDYTFNAAAIEVEAKTGAVRKLMDYRKGVPTPYKTTKVPGNTWYIPRVRFRMPEYEEHPSQKPEALLERVILASSNEGDVVLDPFGGTFSTAAVAQRLGRRSISFDLQDSYVKIGLRRLGIASHHNGKELAAPDKKYARRNANGVHGGAIKDDPQPQLFDGKI